MKIALVNLTGGGLSGGYVKYLRTLLPILREHPDVTALDVYSPPETREMLGDRAVDHYFWNRNESARNFAGLRATVQRSMPDVVFIPTARWRRFGDIPVCSMVRNMEPLEIPFATHSLADSVRNLGRRYEARRACRSAHRVIAVSRYVREFLVERWSVPEEKIGLVYHGIDTPRSISDADRPQSVAQIKDAPFVFTAGSIRPARGLEDIIVAFGELKLQRREFRLVIAGVPSGTPAYRASILRLIAKSGIEAETVWAGHLSPNQMSWCYSHCAAFAMTSRVEACPNTALEALAHGALIVSTENPPMPEFFGDSALYYAAGDSAQLAARLDEGLSLTAETRAALSLSARERTRPFTWRRTADSTVAELKQCMAG